MPFLARFGLPGGFNVVTREVEVFPTTQPEVREVGMVEPPDAQLGGGALPCVEVTTGAEVNLEDVHTCYWGHIEGCRPPECVDFVDEWPISGCQRTLPPFWRRAAGGVMPSGMAGGAMYA